MKTLKEQLKQDIVFSYKKYCALIVEYERENDFNEYLSLDTLEFLFFYTNENENIHCNYSIRIVDNQFIEISIYELETNVICETIHNKRNKVLTLSFIKEALKTLEFRDYQELIL